MGFWRRLGEREASGVKEAPTLRGRVYFLQKRRESSPVYAKVGAGQNGVWTAVAVERTSEAASYFPAEPRRCSGPTLPGWNPGGALLGEGTPPKKWPPAAPRRPSRQPT